MKSMPLNRLAALEKVRLRERPVHLLWVDHGDTDADVEERRHRLIAEGRASARPTGSFVSAGNEPRLPRFPVFVLYFTGPGSSRRAEIQVRGLRRQLLAPLLMNASRTETCVFSPSKSCAICS